MAAIADVSSPALEIQMYEQICKSDEGISVLSDEQLRGKTQAYIKENGLPLGNIEQYKRSYKKAYSAYCFTKFADTKVPPNNLDCLRNSFAIKRVDKVFNQALGHNYDLQRKIEIFSKAWDRLPVQSRAYEIAIQITREIIDPLGAFQRVYDLFALKNDPRLAALGREGYIKFIETEYPSLTMNEKGENVLEGIAKDLNQKEDADLIDILLKKTVKEFGKVGRALERYELIQKVVVSQPDLLIEASRVFQGNSKEIFDLCVSIAIKEKVFAGITDKDFEELEKILNLVDQNKALEGIWNDLSNEMKKKLIVLANHLCNFGNGELLPMLMNQKQFIIYNRQDLIKKIAAHGLYEWFKELNKIEGTLEHPNAHDGLRKFLEEPRDENGVIDQFHKDFRRSGKLLLVSHGKPEVPFTFPKGCDYEKEKSRALDIIREFAGNDNELFGILQMSLLQTSEATIALNFKTTLQRIFGQRVDSLIGISRDKNGFKLEKKADGSFLLTVEYTVKIQNTQSGQKELIRARFEFPINQTTGKWEIRQPKRIVLKESDPWKTDSEPMPLPVLPALANPGDGVVIVKDVNKHKNGDVMSDGSIYFAI